MNLNSKKNWYPLFTVFVIISGIFLYDYVIDCFMSNHQETTAIIISHSEWRPRGGHVIELEYEVNGEQYVRTISQPEPLDCFDTDSVRSCAGQIVKIQYSERNPSIFEIIRE